LSSPSNPSMSRPARTSPRNWCRTEDRSDGPSVQAPRSKLRRPTTSTCNGPGTGETSYSAAQVSSRNGPPSLHGIGGTCAMGHGRWHPPCGEGLLTSSAELPHLEPDGWPRPNSVWDDPIGDLRAATLHAGERHRKTSTRVASPKNLGMDLLSDKRRPPPPHVPPRLRGGSPAPRNGAQNSTRSWIMEPRSDDSRRLELLPGLRRSLCDARVRRLVCRGSRLAVEV
jgi:hypothetical protein